MNERIKRLSSVPDFRSYHDGLQSASDFERLSSINSSNLPPTYSAAQFDDPYSQSSLSRSNSFAGPSNANANADKPLYQDIDCKNDDIMTPEEEWQLAMQQQNYRGSAPGNFPSKDQAMYYGERMAYTRNQKFKKKASKILIPLATGTGGAVAGALGGAAIGAAVSGGIAAPVGFVVGAVVGGSAGASVGIAATNNSKFDKAMTTYKGSKCTGCSMYLDSFAGSPICCPTCRRLFCSNCVVQGDSSETSYCEFCARSLPTPNYRRVTYRDK